MIILSRNPKVKEFIVIKKPNIISDNDKIMLNNNIKVYSINKLEKLLQKTKDQIVEIPLDKDECFVKLYESNEEIFYSKFIIMGKEKKHLYFDCIIKEKK